MESEPEGLDICVIPGEKANSIWLILNEVYIYTLTRNLTQETAFGNVDTGLHSINNLSSSLI